MTSRHLAGMVYSRKKKTLRGGYSLFGLFLCKKEFGRVRESEIKEARRSDSLNTDKH